jgi:hypothetical protein
MNPNRRRKDDVTPTSGEVKVAASVLEARHGIHAAEIAEFFSELNRQTGNIDRSWAWAGVADIVRRREWARIQAA